MEDAIEEANNWSESGRGSMALGSNELNICCICLDKQIE